LEDAIKMNRRPAGHFKSKRRWSRSRPINRGTAALVPPSRGAAGHDWPILWRSRISVGRMPGRCRRLPCSLQVQLGGRLLNSESPR